MHLNHRFVTLIFGVTVASQVSIRGSDRHSFSLHRVLARDSSKFRSLCFVQIPSPGARPLFHIWVIVGWIPGLARRSLASLHPYAWRRAQPLQPRKLNVCLALRQLRPQKPSDTRKEAPGAQAPPAKGSRVVGANPNSNLTPANREEN